MIYFDLVLSFDCIIEHDSLVFV